MNCFFLFRFYSRYRVFVINIFFNWYEVNFFECISQFCFVIKFCYFVIDYFGSVIECFILCKNVYYKCKEVNYGDFKNIILIV